MQTYEIHPAGTTDIGNVRATNQDHLLAEGGLVAVADGMGGQLGGEVASRVAVEALREAFSADRSAAGLVEAVRRANRAVYERAEAQPELAGMGTTIVAVALVREEGEEQLAVVNVGDSRAYLLQQGGLRRLSSDHSLVADLVRAGELTEEGARNHPERHVLTRVLGVAPEVEPHASLAAPARGDRLLACSDGLFNELGEEEILAVLATVAEPGEAADRLVALAKDHGGSDNITAVVLDIR